MGDVLEAVALLGIFKSLSALVFVLGLIGLLYFLFKKYMAHNILAVRNSKFRIEEIFYLDPKRRIVSVARDNKIYILLLGPQDQLLDTVIKQGGEHIINAAE